MYTPVLRYITEKLKTLVIGKFLSEQKAALMIRAVIILCTLTAAPPLFGITIQFDDAPFPTGSRSQQSYSNGEFYFSGQFSHTGGLNSGRPSNTSLGFLSVLNGGQVQVIRSTGPFFMFDSDTGEQIPAEPIKLPFDAISVDLAEYSTLFAVPAEVTFFGMTVTGQELIHTFTTDGVIDSLGGLEDFESFNFPETFRNLVSLTTHMPQIGTPGLNAFAFDNLNLSPTPEPTTLTLAAFGLLGLCYRPKRA